MGLIIFLIVVVLIVLYFVAIYNGLVTSRNGYKNAFAQIDVQLTRRHDLRTEVPRGIARLQSIWMARAEG